MIKAFDYNGMHCEFGRYGNGERIAYILYPVDMLEGWLEQAIEYYKTSIVVVRGMDWNNSLTPWPAPGEPKGSPDFKGDAQEFLTLLTTKLMPLIEGELELSPNVERTLVGVSLSGLFALWQWMSGNTKFKSIASLSGSFWYDGFLDWFDKQPLPKTGGKAFFLLGELEKDTKVKAFQSVAKNTAAIVERLSAGGIDTHFEWVPGNHYADPIPRLDSAFKWLYRR